METIQIHDKYFVPFINRDKIERYVAFLANQIAQDLDPNEVPIFIGILNGSFMFADDFVRKPLFTDYQENCCAMNPYLSPDLTMYACCDAGSHFNTTHFFNLGNLSTYTVEDLLLKSENHQLYNCIRSMGITGIASFAGFKAREIVTYRKCELCKKMFDSPQMLKDLTAAAMNGLLSWNR